MSDAGTSLGSKAGAPPAFSLRAASVADYDFAWGLYVESMCPLLSALDAWDAAAIETAFQGYFVVDEIEIVVQNGQDVGWVQVSETNQELFLDQLHLIEDVRGQGIGTALIHAVIARATAHRRNVSLSLIKGNKAVHLYRRLGFCEVAQDVTKIHMRYVTDRPILRA